MGGYQTPMRICGSNWGSLFGVTAVAKPGDRIRDFVTAAWFNEVSRKTFKIKTGNQIKFVAEDLTSVTVRNHEAVAKEIFSVVGLGDFLADDRTERIFETEAPDLTNWVILQEPLDGRIGATAKAMVVGSSWVNLGDLGSDPTQYVTVSGGIAVPSSTGKAKILLTETDEDDNVWAFVALALEAGGDGTTLQVGIVQTSPAHIDNFPRVGNVIGREHIKNVTRVGGVLVENGDAFIAANLSRQELAVGDYVIYQPSTTEVPLIITAFC